MLTEAKKTTCRYCEEGMMTEEAYSRLFGPITVDGLLHWRCNACDSVMTDSAQYETNWETVEKAMEKQ